VAVAGLNARQPAQEKEASLNWGQHKLQGAKHQAVTKLKSGREATEHVRKKEATAQRFRHPASTLLVRAN